MTTEFAFEVPVYIYLSVTFAILFSLFRLYLSLQELFGLNLREKENQQEQEQSAADDPEAAKDENEGNLLNRIGETVMINDAVDVVKKTFTDRKYLMRFAILIDVLLFIFLSINVTLLLVGVDQFYHTDQVDAAIKTFFLHQLVLCCCIDLPSTRRFDLHAFQIAKSADSETCLPDRSLR